MSRPLSLHGLFDPYLGHCIAALVFIWRLLFHFTGVKYYRIYQIPTLSAHLLICACLYIVCKRAKVRPWIAASICASLVLFGPGYLDIRSAFQIAFTGSMVCGLIAMLLTDSSDRQLSWRDGLALAFGLVSLLFSAVGIAMVIGVTIAIWSRRGLRSAAFHAVPLAILFLVWFQAFPSRDQLNKPKGSTLQVSRDVLRWIGHAYAGGFGAIAEVGVPGAGVVAGILMACGLFLGFRRTTLKELLRARGLVLGCLAASLAFVIFSGIERAGKLEDVSSSHYVYVYTALLLPAVALGCELVIRRMRTIGVVAIAIVLFAGLQNATGLYRAGHTKTLFTASGAASLLATAGTYPPAGRATPPLIVTYPFSFALPAPWLLRVGRQGRLPSPPPEENSIWNHVRINYGVVPRPGIGPTDRCTAPIGAKGLVIQPRQDQILGLQTQLRLGDDKSPHRFDSSTVTLQLVGQQNEPLLDGSVTYNIARMRRLEVLDGNLRIRVTGSSPTFRICGI